MPYCHPKESAHAQDAREAREKAAGLPDQSTLRLGYYVDDSSLSTTEVEKVPNVPEA